MFDYKYKALKRCERILKLWRASNSLLVTIMTIVIFIISLFFAFCVAAPGSQSSAAATVEQAFVALLSDNDVIINTVASLINPFISVDSNIVANA